MTVIKVGGSTLRTPIDFERLAQRIGTDHASPMVVVVSALPQVTRQLEQAALLAENGEQEQAQSLIATVVAHHRNVARQVLHDRHVIEALEMLFDELYQQLLRLVRGTALTRELTPRTRDRITSCGERMALHLIHHVLVEEGVEVTSVPATGVIVTDATYGNAEPLYEQTAERVQQRILPILQRGCSVLTEGFVGTTRDGDVTTMGKESSNLTAALLARVIGAENLVLYTPVAGIYTADPLLVPTARPIACLSYQHAEHLAHAGLKLLYPTMIAPLREQSIQLRIAALDPSESHATCIGNDGDEVEMFVLLAERLCGVELTRSSYRSALERGWHASGIIAEHGMRVIAAATAVELAVLEHLGIAAYQRGECWQIRVWAYASRPAVHRRIAATLSQLPSLAALTAAHSDDISTTTALTWSAALPPLVALHEQIAEDFPHLQGG